MIHCLIPKARLLCPSNDSNLEGSWHHSFLDQPWKLPQLITPYVYQLMLQVLLSSLPSLLISHKSPHILLHQKEKNVWATFIANTHFILNQRESEYYSTASRIKTSTTKSHNEVSPCCYKCMGGGGDKENTRSREKFLNAHQIMWLLPLLKFLHRLP